MHGSITDGNVVPHQNGPSHLASSGTSSASASTTVGTSASDTVDEPQRPEDALRTCSAARRREGRAAVRAARRIVRRPAVYLYANTYPDEVVGMVLLDSMFPDELPLDGLFKPQDRFKAFHAEDEDEPRADQPLHGPPGGQPFIGNEPAIPVTYLASLQEPWDSSGIPAYDAEIKIALATFVDRLKPGRCFRVNSPHFMEPAIPSRDRRRNSRHRGGRHALKRDGLADGCRPAHAQPLIRSFHA